MNYLCAIYDFMTLILVLSILHNVALFKYISTQFRHMISVGYVHS